MLQVFRAANPAMEEAACASLEVIGCNDDYPGCGADEGNSSICVTNLTVGETYYILLASSFAFYLGPYRISIESPCPDSMVPDDNNRCVTAPVIVDGVHPFTLEGALFDCPAEPELPTMTNDIWWKYTAPYAGELTVETCDPTGQGDAPATTLAVYGDSDCPPGEPVAANDDAGGSCASASSVNISVFAGEEYMIRLGGEYGGVPEGFLSIICEIDDCNNNGAPDLWEIQMGDLEDCNQNLEPDECDIDPADPDQNGHVSEDCDANGIPDECQIDIFSIIDCSLHDPAPCYEGPTYCLFDCDPDVNENGIPDICDDSDLDGVPDPFDNCPHDANPSQDDNENDGLGDVCDPDDDNDGAPDTVDNCPMAENPGQEDNEGDGLGDVCDPDDDNDTIPDAIDNCPFDANLGQEDCDGDAEGDACEADMSDRDHDGDGVCNGVDNCPGDANPDQKDKDRDGLGDVCDPCPKVPGPCFQPRPIDAKRRSPGRS
jgi:hypothetical protein